MDLLREGKLNNGIDFFLEDEVRNGFYVPAVMKQCWAAEIQVMEDLRQVCDKHGLKFYADWGSLLGAARHGGFIPWDDDLDVLMFREDYMTLIDLYEKHPEEFPENFEVRSFRNRDDLLEFHGVVVGCGHISFDADHLTRYHGFPYIAAVDIFVLDHKSKDIEKQKEMAKDALFTIALADEIASGNIKDKPSLFANLEKVRSMKFAKGVPSDLSLSPIEMRTALYEVAETMCASFYDEKSDELIQNIPWGLKYPESAIPLSNYSEQVFLPFEYTSIPAPVAYDSMLTRKYRDYLKVVKNVGAHEYPCFAQQERSFKANLDFELPEFKYDASVLTKIEEGRAASRANCWKTTMTECVSQMKTLANELSLADGESSLQLLADIQQLAIDLGGFCESITEKAALLVSELEGLCEAVFNLYNAISENNLGDALLEDFYASIGSVEKAAIKLSELKQVAIFTFKPEGWKNLDTEYRRLLEEDNTDVKIIPVPYYHKSFDERLKDEVYITDGYPEDVELTAYSDYDLTLRHPEIIITQFPYDNWNKVMTVSKDYQTFNLAVNSEELVYIPWFLTDDFTKDDYCDYVNTKYYVSMPGVTYADRVIVNSEAIREVYIERLRDFAGEGNWEEKITVAVPREQQNERKECKKLFYYLGLCSFIQNEETIIKKIESNIEVFRENGENIKICFFPDPAIEMNLPRLRPELWAKLKRILEKDEFEILSSDTKPEQAAKLCDAYYGDKGRYVRAFIDAKKPVMVQNPEII